MSLFGMPEGTPCCCLSGCCEGLTMPDCVTLELTSSCCPGDIATIVLTKEDGSGCVDGDPRPFTAAEARCEPNTPALIYTGSIPDAWCATSGLGDATVNLFCCIDPLTGDGSFWLYIGGSDLGVTWYPTSTPHYYQLTLISCDPFLLQFGSTPDCGGDTCIWTWSTGGCFVERTLVKTPTGEVGIETLKVGDLVIDIHGQTVVVFEVIPTEVDFLLCVTAENGVETGVTPEHPFIRADMTSTIEAKDLTSERALPFGKKAVKTQLFKATEEKFKVYNLSVSGSNTFIADGFAVHNKGNS